MPITKSAKKAIRGSEKKRIFNLRRRKLVDNVTREIKALLKDNKVDDAKKLISKAQQVIDKAVKGKTIKKNTASRKKSRLIKLIKKAVSK